MSGGGTTFNQQNQQVGQQTNVGGDMSVAGDIKVGDVVLSQGSSSEDVRKALLAVIEELTKLQGVPDASRGEIEQELESAANEAIAPEGSKDAFPSRLQRIKQKLEGVSGVAEGALALAKTVVAIAGIVGLAL